MDNSINSNEIIIERIRLKDIISSIRDIFTRSKDIGDDDVLNQRLKEIYKVQDQLGVTKSIEGLVKSVESHHVEQKRKKSKLINNEVTMNGEMNQPELVNDYRSKNVIEIDYEK